MKGLQRIRTVRDLKNYLGTCPDESEILLMTENGDGDGFPIGGILDFPSNRETWILIDEFSAVEEGAGDDDEEWAMNVGAVCEVPRVEGPTKPQKQEEEEEDVVVVRGKMRSA